MTFRKRIIYDCDGTLLAYQEEVISFVNRRSNSNLNLNDVERHDCYDILGDNHLTRLVNMARFYRETRGLRTIPAVEGAIEAVAEITRRGKGNYGQGSVTSRFKWFSRATIESLHEKFDNALERVHFSYIPSVHSSKLKPKKYFSLKPDVVVEDSPEVARKCAEMGINVILLNRPYNEHANLHGIIRTSWPQIPDIIENIFEISSVRQRQEAAGLQMVNN